MSHIGQDRLQLEPPSARPARTGKLLTVFIPSYNRADKLDRCLRRLFKTIDATAFRDQIEVLVVDDFSSEPVERVIHAHRGRNRSLRYILHDTKCGVAEIAMLNCIQHVETQFAWCLGNDDYVLESAFDYLVPILRRSESSFFLLNFVGEEQDGTRYKYFRSKQTEVVFESGRQFFLNFGFISATTTFPCLCFDVACLRDCDISRVTDLSPIYSHTALFARAFRDRRCSFLPTPVAVFSHNEEAAEQEKLSGRNLAFKHPAFFHASAGLARHLLALSQDTGIPLEELAAAHEDEIEKTSKTIKRTVLAYFIFKFAIVQLMHEMRVFHAPGDVSNDLCFVREDMELLDDFFRRANFSELSALLRQARGIYCDSRLRPEDKNWHLSNVIRSGQAFESRMLAEIAPLANAGGAIYYGDRSGPKLLYDDVRIFRRRAA